MTENSSKESGRDAGSSAPAGGSTAAGTRPTPTRRPPKTLPPWKVLLHNDDVNDMEYVVESIQMIVHLSKQDSALRALEAHESGVALLLTTHQERAELIQQQFTSRNLSVTIEPAEG